MKFALMNFKNIENAENRNDLTASQNETASNKSIKKSKSGLLVYSASELLSTFDGKETDFLWDNLIPRVGTGLLVGQPDLGKSQLAKELAIMIAKGSSEHLGMKLKPIHNHVLYVFTEDQEEGVSSSLHKQLIKHSDLDKSKLSLAFLRDESIAELIQKLDAFCSLTPVDLVVIDAFGDIFSGSDSNNNIQMRRDIKAFDDIVRKHKISVLFVHHINKSGYGKNPSQELIQGGSGLTQKVRFALFLSRNDDGQKFLNVAKGNYSSSFYKDNRLPVDFDEETLTFEVNGDWEPLEKSTKKQKSDLNDDDLFMIFKNNGLSFNQVCAKIIDCLNVSQSTAERRIVKLVNKGRITKVDNLYYRSEFFETTTLTSKTLGKNEVDGDVFSLGKVEDLNISTLNPQTLVYFEGDGKEIDTEIADGIIPPTLFIDAVEFENEEQSTLNPQYLLGNEGEGNLDWHDELESIKSMEPVVEYPIDPNIRLIHKAIEASDYNGDENFYNAMEDFYINSPKDLSVEVMSKVELEFGLQDYYTVTRNQAKLMIEILKDLKIIRIDGDGIVRA
ncbi:MAG: AAA family ATPase [Flavobacteriaceae bacterium]|nr:AAA family ATPase [Flavobacteriaceae bacterium]